MLVAEPGSLLYWCLMTWADLLGFLRRNISKFPEEIKKRASQAKVRPNVEYASSAWDPYQENHIKKISPFH
jgi:hypothetical protein